MPCDLAHLSNIHIKWTPNQNLIWFTTPVSGGYKSSVYSGWQFQKRVLLTSWYIYWYFFCDLSSRLYFNMSNSSLYPSSLVWWYALIWWVCVFSHSRKLFCFSKALFFRKKSHHICRLVYQNLQYSFLYPNILL